MSLRGVLRSVRWGVMDETGALRRTGDVRRRWHRAVDAIIYCVAAALGVLGVVAFANAWLAMNDGALATRYAIMGVVLYVECGFYVVMARLPWRAERIALGLMP